MRRREPVGVSIFAFALTFALTFVLVLPGWLRADDATEPEEITIDQLADLYEPVVFQHQLHTEIYECSSCHHDSEAIEEETESCGRCHGGTPFEAQAPCVSCHKAGVDEGTGEAVEERASTPYHIDTPALKGAWHMLCRNCHLEEGGPAECQDCHDYTDKGRRFFHEKE